MLDIDVFIEKTRKKSRLIGIDPGGKRIGIALSDENKIVATPYTTIIKENYRELVDQIQKIVKEYDIDGIVIGNPINMDGTEGPSSQSAKDLAKNLSKDITENITLWDERLSSQGGKLDENSAQFILQGMLDYFHNKNTWYNLVKGL